MTDDFEKHFGAGTRQERAARLDGEAMADPTRSSADEVALGALLADVLGYRPINPSQHARWLLLKCRNDYDGLRGLIVAMRQRGNLYWVRAQRKNVYSLRAVLAEEYQKERQARGEAPVGEFISGVTGEICDSGSAVVMKEKPMSNTEWSTPQEFFDRLDAEFHFDLDPCATDKNAKCARYFTKADNGLAQPWDGAVFVNPPYGHTPQWTAKACRMAQQGATVVMLLPARTDTRWWHEHVIPCAKEIRFIQGRLYFTDQAGNTGRSPFPSVVVVFHARSPLSRFTSMNARRS